MKVLLVNTSDKTGGAAVAASRLMNALRKSGVEVALAHSGCSPRRWKMMKAIERGLLLPSLKFNKQNLWAVDPSWYGVDITSLPEYKEADVIHLHWINQGFLSIDTINKILHSGKRVVWTMHDLWPAASICHYANDCERFKTSCHNCPLLPNGGSINDLSAKVWRKKTKVLTKIKHNITPNEHLSFVACSHWLEGQAKESALLKGFDVQSVPNPIDQTVFCRKDSQEAREALNLPAARRLILFVSQKVTDERKGACYFIEAVNSLAENDERFRATTAVMILGGHSEEIVTQLNIKAYSLGYVSDTAKIVNVYNAADTFVLPSLQDNLPNTIMEAMACGVPCVGFDIGGIPEMIDHNINGFVAQPKDSKSLAEGLLYCLSNDNHQRLSEACLDKVTRCYSETVVAQQFIELYNSRPIIPNI